MSGHGREKLAFFGGKKYYDRMPKFVRKLYLVFLSLYITLVFILPVLMGELNSCKGGLGVCNGPSTFLLVLLTLIPFTFISFVVPQPLMATYARVSNTTSEMGVVVLLFLVLAFLALEGIVFVGKRIFSVIH